MHKIIWIFTSSDFWCMEISCRVWVCMCLKTAKILEHIAKHIEMERVSRKCWRHFMTQLQLSCQTPAIKTGLIRKQNWTISQNVERTARKWAAVFDYAIIGNLLSMWIFKHSLLYALIASNGPKGIYLLKITGFHFSCDLIVVLIWP